MIRCQFYLNRCLYFSTVKAFKLVFYWLKKNLLLLLLSTMKSANERRKKNDRSFVEFNQAPAIQVALYIYATFVCSTQVHRPICAMWTLWKTNQILKQIPIHENVTSCIVLCNRTFMKVINIIASSGFVVTMNLTMLPHFGSTHVYPIVSIH